MVLFLFLGASIVIHAEYTMMGRGFDKGRNYWYFNTEKEAEKWQSECKGRLDFFAH